MTRPEAATPSTPHPQEAADRQVQRPASPWDEQDDIGGPLAAAQRVVRQADQRTFTDPDAPSDPSEAQMEPPSQQQPAAEQADRDQLRPWWSSRRRGSGPRATVAERVGGAIGGLVGGPGSGDAELPPREGWDDQGGFEPADREDGDGGAFPGREWGWDEADERPEARQGGRSPWDEQDAQWQDGPSLWDEIDRPDDSRPPRDDSQWGQQQPGFDQRGQDPGPQRPAPEPLPQVETDDGRAAMREGRGHEEAGDLDQALAAYTRAIAAERGRSAEPLLARARLHLKAERYPQALGDANILARRWPDNPEPYQLRAEIYQAMGNETAAERQRQMAQQRGGMD